MADKPARNHSDRSALIRANGAGRVLGASAPDVSSAYPRPSPKDAHQGRPARPVCDRLSVCQDRVRIAVKTSRGPDMASKLGGRPEWKPTQKDRRLVEAM